MLNPITNNVHPKDPWTLPADYTAGRVPFTLIRILGTSTITVDLAYAPYAMNERDGLYGMELALMKIQLPSVPLLIGRICD